MNAKPLSHIAFEAYAERIRELCGAFGDMPEWGELTPENQAAWESAARAVERIVEDRE